ncbi:MULTISPECIES: ImmA/IrrE family metallo-endopeptidase [unclassified Lysobacter]|uniref:ImmA/IrrE family metallo-endopeptidase n=1 Tax=unclassified Lysobacter TaxID=2635362 RepID=UPI001BEADAEF|nr:MULTISPECIES: ImmA/IrrE family metallo-endopeptidase [unclassified Lysobacter]MBT2748300.1 ImmA/IrrE family metallo-endopeptidase [Lysobacter sp. ISL-42]MBT2749933.1 ImmA/IrrE family metallo-endopeptidase [Lysobacter sp. ISL-50]MBT2781261.1 ImmA/IrrE family metallo-endopeptidase [Lysobacter sp. ISL-52]
MLPLIMAAARRASEVYRDSGAKGRVEQEGYTRVDPFLIAGKERVPVLLRPLDKLLGAFIRDDASGILINSERSAGLIHMTCAHELGHYFMGHDSTADDSLDYGPQAARHELEADWFAYQLMVPRALLAHVMRRKGWTMQSLADPRLLYQLSLRLGISYTAAAWSLARHKLMAPAEVKRLINVQPLAIKEELLAGQAFDARKEVWLLDERDRDSVLEPRAEDRIVVRFSSHASAGYLWALDELASEGFQIRPTRASSKEGISTDSVFGGPTTAEFLLAHDTAGVNDSPAVLAMEEVRPWAKETPANTFEARTSFENIAPGLTSIAKQQLLRESPTA